MNGANSESPRGAPTVRLEVNGVPVEVGADGARTLASALRDELGLTATKVACGRGECGACTVLLGGRPVMSCVTPVAFVREPVETLEGVAEEVTDLREEFTDRGAFQCGFCTPGQLVHCAALTREFGKLADTEDLPGEVRRQLSGNICRCTGYQAITSAVCTVITRRAGRGMGETP